MADKYFIDTGAYFSRFYGRDQHHAASLDIWNWLENKNITAVTTNHVIDELATLLARRTSYDFSGSKLDEIYESEDTQIERSSEEDERKALVYFKKYADQKISFTDCLSFVIMEKLSINRVFTFDRHFQYAGFDIISQSQL
jgi:hypothetical protein